MLVNRLVAIPLVLATFTLLVTFFEFSHRSEATPSPVLGALSAIRWMPNRYGAGQTSFLAEDRYIALEKALSVPENITNTGDYEFFQKYTEATLRELAMCTVRRNCAKNADKIVIFNNIHAHMAKFEGYKGGEGGWTLSMLESMQRLGYTVLFTRTRWQYVYHLYQQFPDNIVAVVSGEDGDKTLYDFIKHKGRLDGIPAWKFFFFYYFQNPWTTIVGNKWVIVGDAPLPYGPRPQTYIGYHQPIPDLIIPFEKRKNRVYILAKSIEYFTREWAGSVAWPTDFYQRAVDELTPEFPGFEFVSGSHDPNKDRNPPLEVPKGVTQVGRLTPEEFKLQIANSRAMLGIGWPGNSPSPYNSMARGVPFINPFREHENDPTKIGRTQHGGVSQLLPPRVYHALAGNYTQFVNAIRQALSTPMEPFIFDFMRAEEQDKRIEAWLTHDWRSEAAGILEERMKGNETQHLCDLNNGPARKCEEFML